MRRLVLSIAWAVALVLLLTSAPLAGDVTTPQGESPAVKAARDAVQQAAKIRREKALAHLRAVESGDQTAIDRTKAALDKAVKQENTAREGFAEAQRGGARTSPPQEPTAPSDEATRLRKIAQELRDRAEKIDMELSPEKFNELSRQVDVERARARALRTQIQETQDQDERRRLATEALFHERQADKFFADAEKLQAQAAEKIASAERLRRSAENLELEANKRAHEDEMKKAFDQPPELKKAFDKAAKESLDQLLKTFRELTEGETALDQSVSTDITVIVNNRPKTLVCILPGDNVEKVAAALGLADYEVVAQTGTGTVIAAYGDPQTIEAEAKAKRIPLCFVEINFCVIKAPLTAFRGHQHKAHPGGIHNHDAPDPPWSWAVTPPEPVVSWGGR